MYDCEACPFRERHEALSREAVETLALYRWLAAPVVRDLSLTPYVFDLFRLRMRPTEALALLERLSACHEHATARAKAQVDLLRES
jgi:hypothetical protein